MGEVWVPDEKLVWVRLPILSPLDAERGVVEVAGKGELKLTACHIVDESHLVDREDLCGMNRLHEAPLLDTLRRRFSAGKIYTTTDSVLLSINPYKLIEGLYDRPCLYLDIPNIGEEGQQRGRKRGGGGLPPHVFRIANDALASMVVNASDPDQLESSSRHFVNQSLIISGESGSGKTEASKQVMVFLIAADGEMSDSSSDVGEEIKEELLGSNVVFEAFGNAKTIRNDNSSRFGKFIKLLYNSDNRIVSAVTETFLLEKSRLVELGAGERCFHVFYMLLAGLNQLDAQLAQELKLQQQQPAAFPMLRDRAGATHASEGDASLPSLAAALAKVGFSPDELSSLWSLLACILHMSNVAIEESKGEGGPVEASCSSMPLDSLAQLLGLDFDSLLHALTEQTIQAGGRASMHSKRLGPAESRNNLLALSKFLYSSVFDFLVRKVNHAHSKGAGGERFIGVLDIFGFEILTTNSFEQLCINYTNERLQQQFNSYVFTLEQEEYAQEGLDWSRIHFLDNQEVIDLISKKTTGLLPLLEEQCMLQRSNAAEGEADRGLLQSFNQRHVISDLYSRSRFDSGGAFVVAHYAGQVEYKIAGFVAKNNESLQEDLLGAVVCTENTFLFNIVVAGNPGLGLPQRQGPGFLPTPTVSSSSSSASSPGGAGAGSGAGARALGGKKMAATITVSYQFRAQLDALISALRQTEPRFVKCIKPNDAKAPHQFDAPLVVQQLRYSGAMEVVRIRREGYPWSVRYAEFVSEFSLLARADVQQALGGPTPAGSTLQASSAAGGEADQAARAAALSICVAFLPPTQYAEGRSKLFLRDGAYVSLALGLARAHNHFAAKIQSQARGRQQRLWFTAAKLRVKVLQALLRGASARRLCSALASERAARRAAELEQQRAEAARLAAEAAAAAAAAAEAARIAAEAAAAEAKRLAEEEARRREEERRAAEAQAAEAQRQAEEEERRREEERRAAEAEAARLKAAADAAAAEAKRLAEEEARRVEAERIAAEAEAARLAELARLEKERLARVASIHAAAAAGDVVLLGRLLDAAPADEANCPTPAADGGLSMLQSACKHGQLEVAKYLNPARSQVLAASVEGRTALHYALTLPGAAAASSSAAKVACGTRTALLHFLLAACQPLLELSEIFPLSPSAGAAAASARRNPRRDEERAPASDLPSASAPGQAPSSASASASASRSGKSASRLFGQATAALLGARDKHIAAPVGAHVLKEGWLSKRGETKAWRRRWVKLTADSLQYYHSPQDALPRDTISLLLNCGEMKVERIAGPDGAPAVTLKLSSSSGQKKRSRIDLMASTEEEMLAWVTPLKGLAGLSARLSLRAAATGGVGVDASKLPPVHYWDSASVSSAIVAASGPSGSPAKLLAGLDGATKDGEDSDKVEAGVMRRLVHDQGPGAPLPGFIVFPGFSYLSIFLCSLTLADGAAQAGAIDSVVVSLRDSATGTDIEPSKTITPAVTAGRTHVALGATVFFKTPLDEIGPSYCLSVHLGAAGEAVVPDIVPAKVDSGFKSAVVGAGGSVLFYAMHVFRAAV